jgi:outer membrane protein
MKKIYLSIIAVIFTLICFCQERGIADNKNLIVTSFGGSSISSLKNDSTEFTWKQKFGYFVNSNVNVGMGFEFGSSDKYSLDAFVRYYYTPQNKFSFFTGADVKYIISDEKNIKMKGIGVSVYPGINYFITDGLAIESSIGLLSYTSEFQKNNSANTTNNLNFEMKLKTLNIGLICSF